MPRSKEAPGLFTGYVYGLFMGPNCEIRHRASPLNLLNILDMYGCRIARGWKLSMYNFQVRASYDSVHIEDTHAVLRGPCMASTGAHTSQMAHFSLDLAYVTRTCTHRGPLGTAGLIVQVFPSPYGTRRKPLLCPHDWMYGCFQGYTFHRGPYVARTQTLRKPEVAGTDSGDPDTQRTCKTPVGMLPIIVWGSVCIAFLQACVRPPSPTWPGTTCSSPTI